MPSAISDRVDVPAILGGLAFAIIWSSAFTSAKIIVNNAPPLTASAVRFLIAGLIALALARILGQSFTLTRQQWQMTVLFGICQNGLYLGLNFVALKTVEASLASIIASTLPLLVAFAGWLITKETLRPLGVAGLFAGMAGVVLIMGTRLTQGVDPAGIALCGIGVLALTFATLAVKGASSGGNVMVVVGFQMLVGSAVLWAPALALETLIVNWSVTFVAAFLYTLFLPGLLATLAWFWLVRRIGATRAATFHFMNPFLGVAIAAALLGEAIGVLDVIGVVIIALAILAVQFSKSATTT
ncbi:MAG: DMT family transporter [Boseongicola sp. SB0664_bin_43]|uniref:DMT family transporter n=1 Tax=Boseongicola sp. SB0664_bin_43 TaxID=2604844 RepID=A0A6B0XZH7_9RHOB|nr:DMT family transporter [Boseongicola sp. SB0664_bin_43]